MGKPFMKLLLFKIINRFANTTKVLGLAMYLLAGSIATQAQCFMADLPAEEAQSLTSFYENTNGPNWDNNYGWLNPIVPVDEWFGVNVNETLCTVTAINISGPMGNNVAGILPNLNLPNLQILRISGGNITGTLPDFNFLINLDILDLNKNHIQGNIPDFQLPNLFKLELSDNNFSGQIPDFSGLPNLQELNLERNQLTGQIPDFSAIPQLDNLRLHHNLLSGYIPNFTNLPILEHLIVCPNAALLPPIPQFNYCPQLEINSNDFWCIEQVSVSGQAYYDLNGNCLPDAGEPPIQQSIIIANNGQQYAVTNEQGYYTLTTDTGTYTLSCLPPNNLWQVICTETYTLDANNPDDSFIRNFALQPLTICPLLTIETAAPPLRRCFEADYTLLYCNQGTQTAPDAHIALYLPPTLLPVWSSLPYTQNADTLLFNVGALNIGQCGSLVVRVAVDCNATLGSAACVTATILPLPPCVDNAISGYHLQVTGTCEDGDVKFKVQNLDGNMPDSTTYRVYEDDILSALGKLQLTAGQSQDFTFAATGSTLRMSVNANGNPADPWLSDPQAVVEMCGSEPWSLGFITTTAPPDEAPYTDTDCGTIVGSFDPNSKEANPRGVGEEHFILPDNPICYQVNFQNVGNDTAFTITILDTLNAQQLDFNTLQPGLASHPYSLQILNGSVLQFTFNNILLPDSTTNQTQSQGFIQYSIRPKQDIAEGAQLSNQAYIYFDYNQPIATQPVFHTICRNANTLCMPTTVNTGTIPFQTANTGIVNCYVAANNLYLVQLKEVKQPLQFDLYNIWGQRVHTAIVNPGTTEVPLASLNSGMYLYRITSGRGQLLIAGKVIKP